MSGKRDSKVKVLAVVNRKGGVAKTTTSISLAHGLSHKLLLHVQPEDIPKVPDKQLLYEYDGHYYYVNGHVLLIDFDPQGHCTHGLGINPHEADIGRVLLNEQSLAKAVISADRAADGYPRPNLWLLPASDYLEAAKDTLRATAYNPLMSNSEEYKYALVRILEDRLNVALERFTYIVMDCPPALDAFTQAVYQFADAAVVPVKPDYFSMAGTDQHLSDLQTAQLRGIDIAVHTIVPTFYVERQRLDQALLQQLCETYQNQVSAPIPRSQMVAEAPAKQVTIFEMDPQMRNPATIAYQQLVDRVYYETNNNQ